MKEKSVFLITVLDFFLQEGLLPGVAWNRALETYAYVYHSDDDHLPLSRAADKMLQYLDEKKGVEGGTLA